MPATDPVSSTLLERSAANDTNNEEHASSEADPVEAKRVVRDRDRSAGDDDNVIYLSCWD